MTSTKFVIVANPRTGTNHFIDILNSSENVICHREIFHPHSVYTYEGTRDDLVGARDENPIEFMRTIYSTCSATASGFKIFDGHNASVLNEALIDPSIKKIILYRANYLAVYSSEKIAEANMCYVRISEDQPVKFDEEINPPSKTSPKTFFDIDEFNEKFLRYQAHYKNCIDVLINTNQDYLFVTYEDFLNESFFRRVYSFLGVVQPDKLHSRLQKMNASDIVSRFLNDDDVKLFLEKNNRKNWLYEGSMLWALES